ncbi:MAG: DUF445 domain-containing protein [Myxococcota bacterium]
MDLLEPFRADPYIALIPFFSAFVGWFTNVLAVRMMFYPTEFVGVWKPFIGWQGLVPANARRLARMSTELILTKLLSLRELFGSFKGEEFADELDAVVDDTSEQILDEVKKRQPMLWENAGEFMQNQVREGIREKVREVTIRIVDDFGDNIEDVLDLERVVIDAVVADKKLMSLMFLQVGEAEFKFIERSGIWFGFLFGVIQMFVWIRYPADWVLPLAGFFVGYATNWVALKLIFQPRNPTKVGPFVLHGLFHKRQKEVAGEFSKLTAGKVLNADNITSTITTGETAERIFSIVTGRIGELIDEYEKHPMVAMAVPEGERAEIRTELLQRIRDELPKPGGLLHTFAAKSVNIRDELESRMQQLPPEEFEGVLRPAFQQDEWKLILAGAALGFIAGVLQFVYVFS